MRFHVLAILSLSVAPAVFAQERPFTVDIMMQTEGIAEAMFDPRGQRLLLEKTAAYGSSRNFAWERAWSRERATLMRVDLAGRPVPQTVSPTGEQWWIGSYSPTGAQAAVGWFDGDSAKVGIYNFGTGQMRKLDLRISNSICAFDCPFWLSEDSFLHYSLSTDEQKKELSDIIYTDELTSRWAHHSWVGDEVAVKVLGSGAYKSKASGRGGRIVHVDVRTGEMKTLVEGIVSEMSLSADRRRFAVIRETGDLDMTGLPVSVIFGSEKILELAVYDFSKGGARVLPCETCNVTRGSLRWSPSGDKLFFGARVVRNNRQEHEHYIYDFRRSRLERFAPKGVAFETVADIRKNVFIAPFAWMSEDTPAVRITRKDAQATAASPQRGPEKRAYDWYAVPPGRAAVKITEGLAVTKDDNPLEDFVAAYKGDLLLMADGELWRLSPKGARTNLTQNIAEPLSPWCSAISYWREAGVKPICSGFKTEFSVRPVDDAALKQGWLTFRVLKDDVPTGEMLFLNLDTGQSARVAPPAGDIDLVTATAIGQSVVYRKKSADGDRLLLAAQGGSTTELMYFNQQLKGVAGGKAVMLTRREGNEDTDRYDWLLLPPDHREGDRHPLVVYFYPDAQYSKEWRSSDLRDVSFLNQHIPAAHGYAVLLASMRISSMEKKGNPMTEMHEQLIHAAENVVKQGYADPQRWAIMGHSYGGYGTNSVITQTNRFKAAVAMAGPANLTSGYAIGISAAKATDSATGLSFGAMWSEGGQGRMGVPPWQDPPRYVQNSPVFFADKIQTPLLLVHGDYDFVNINEAEQMFNALQRQGKDAQLLRYWGEGHIFRSPANIRDVWQRIFTWFDQYMDISRDGRDEVIFENHQVKGRRD